MRSLAPLASEMVPPPDQDPWSDPNGPAPCARASAARSRNASANVAPRHARARVGIDRDGMVSPIGCLEAAGRLRPADAARGGAHCPASPLSGMHGAL